jgi:putative ABC transport system substrate-binding protein
MQRTSLPPAKRLKAMLGAEQRLLDFAQRGGLIGYGASLTSLYRKAGIYVGKVLKGAKPADLPIQRPTNFELVINLKAAKERGLPLPLVTCAGR